MRNIIAIIGFTTLLVACGGASTQSRTMDEVRGAAAQTPGSFKLYKAPSIEPNHACDVYTKLTLVNGIAGPVAALENKVAGFCEIAVAANLRAYNVQPQDAGCGSVLLTGERSLVDGRAATLEILDHRTRTCRDVVEAEIIVKETIGGRTVTFYSSAVGAQEVQTAGRFFRMMAIGGETTGFGLMTTDGQQLELDLAPGGFVTQFVEDQDVAVSGFVKTVVGTEIPQRDVVVVTSLSFL